MLKKRDHERELHEQFLKDNEKRFATASTKIDLAIKRMEIAIVDGIAIKEEFDQVKELLKESQAIVAVKSPTPSHSRLSIEDH